MDDNVFKSLQNHYIKRVTLDLSSLAGIRPPLTLCSEKSAVIKQNVKAGIYPTIASNFYDLQFIFHKYTPVSFSSPQTPPYMAAEAQKDNCFSSVSKQAEGSQKAFRCCVIASASLS